MKKQLDKSDITHAWFLLRNKSFDSLCTFGDDYAIKLLEDHEYLIGEVEKAEYFATIQEVNINNWIEDYGILHKRNEELQKALKEIAEYTNPTGEDGREMVSIARYALEGASQ